MQIMFIFSIIWGLGSTIPQGGKKKFDTYFRNLLDGLIKGKSFCEYLVLFLGSIKPLQLLPRALTVKMY